MSEAVRVEFASTPVPEVLRRFGVTTESGLSDRQVIDGRDIVGPNELPQRKQSPLVMRLLRHLAEPIVLLLLIAAAVSAVALHELPEAIAILAIVVVDATISLREESRARDALATLGRVRADTCVVRRDGVNQRIPVRDVVPGDVIVLSAGDRIPADVRIVTSVDAEADESILTGESLAVAKSVEPVPAHLPLSEQASMLSCGTLLTQGTATGIAVATGASSSLGAIASRLEGPETETPLQRELAHLSGRLGVAAAIIAVAVFFLTLALRHEGLELAFLSAVALAIAAVPQGLPAVVSVGLAMGARRMADEGAVVRRLSAVEALGSTKVILTDKTGTLTEGELSFEGALLSDGALRRIEELPPALREQVQEIAALCNDADDSGGDPVDVALLRDLGPETARRLRESSPRVSEVPFSSERGRMSVAYGTDSGLAIAVKGSPEMVLARSNRIASADGSMVDLDERRRGKSLGVTARLAAEGMRVLALAWRELGETPIDLEAEEHDLTLVALVAFGDKTRPEARPAVAEAKSAGIEIVMVTGDHPGTAAAVASQVGITEDGPEVRTGADLARAGIPEDPSQVSVYARVDPEQKLGLVKRFQELGATVAVTGDGVNDAPALRSADIGVAMGATGSDVARDAADMVITDDNLATIVTAVREGRGIYDDIRKVVDYLVAGNMSEITVVLASLLLFPSLGVPLFPLQLLWINLVTDGLPALALGADIPALGLMKRPPRPRSARLLSGPRLAMLVGRGLVMGAAAVSTLTISRYVYGESWAQARTLMFTSIVITHVLYAYLARRPAPGVLSNWRLNAAIASSIVAQVVVVSVTMFQSLFHVVELSSRDWLLVCAAAIVSLVLIAVSQRIAGRGEAVRS